MLPVDVRRVRINGPTLACLVRRLDGQFSDRAAAQAVWGPGPFWRVVLEDIATPSHSRWPLGKSCPLTRACGVANLFVIYSVRSAASRARANAF